MRHLVPLILVGCAMQPSREDLDGTRGGPLEVFFNDPGSRLDNVWTPDVIDLMVDLIDSAGATVDLAVMGFTRDEIYEAAIRAHDRGVRVRMVGDAGHLENEGYAALRARHVPIVAGNGAHIMHDKFFVVDGRFVFLGTANWSTTDLTQNSNNFAILDNPYIAADFTAEFEQMFAGNFGHSKVEIDNGRSYTIGDTEVEVWFSPNEDAMGRMLELVDGAQESVRFTIFAFTKDQVGSALIRAQSRFAEADLAEGVSLSTDFHDRRSVAGVIDQSQLHSNGQYHEVYRLLAAGVPMHLDGDDASSQPGDYQAGGGRLHSKTMVIDAYGENPMVITGSFNWSASASQSNDEYLLVMHGERIARIYDRYFDELYGNGRRMGLDFVGETLQPGDVTIDEVMWYGAHPNDLEGFDEFLELRNHTDRELRLDMWQITNADDVVVGIPPGAVLPPNGRFLILDHVLETYQEGAPQDQGSAYTTGDLILNSFNDNRQARLYLKDTSLELFLQDPAAALVDHVGDGGPPFAGGPENGGVARSMERLEGAVDGTSPASWKACSLPEGGALVSDAPLDPLDPDVTFRDLIRATPGEANSP